MVELHGFTTHGVIGYLTMGLLMFATHGVLNFHHQDRIHENTNDCWENTTIQDCANVGITTHGIITIQDDHALFVPIGMIVPK